MFLNICLDQHGTVDSQTLTDDVDEWPLRVALEEVRPDLQHGESETSRAGGVHDFRCFFVKVDDCICFFNNALDPIPDPFFAVWELVNDWTISEYTVCSPLSGFVVAVRVRLRSHLLKRIAQSRLASECLTLQKNA